MISNNASVAEPRHTLPCRAECDVAVVGGGIAGVAAALAAAREGARVCLLERSFGLGGLATLGLVVEYLPLCDGRGRQVIGGLAERLLHLSVSDGSFEIPAAWREDHTPAQRLDRYRARFNPTFFLLALEREVLAAGIDLRYDTRFCDVHRRRGRIDALLVEDKGGRAALRCRTVVDASGDADVAARCDEPTVSLRNNVPCGWFYYTADGGVELCKMSRAYTVDGKTTDSETGYAGDDPGDVTAQVVHSRRLIMEAFNQRTADRPRGSAGILLAPTLPTFRMTRRLAGEVALNPEDDGTERPDAVTLIGHWRRRGPVLPVSLRALRAVKTPNLILAGRCISATGDAWDAARAIPACAATGEAAGIAAALAAARRTPNLHRLSYRRLKGRLRAAGLILDPGRLPPPAHPAEG